jgi:23S rRNA pseudouridine2604 synthase
MNISLGSLKEGTYRDVTEQEWQELQRLIRDSSNETVIPEGKDNRSNGRRERQKSSL